VFHCRALNDYLTAEAERKAADREHAQAAETTSVEITGEPPSEDLLAMVPRLD
jgi:hypothetical protein